MKSLYESLLTGKVAKPSARTIPSSKKELEQLISEHIKKIKPRSGEEVSFNWIDISDVDDLSELFRGTDYIPVIDKWDITHVKNFKGMFAYNKHIKHSPWPKLQEKLLAKQCYELMFCGCEQLESAPELPAKKLVDFCYRGMFQQCLSLKVAPKLPATQLTSGCYYGMFWCCEALVEPPELPAEQLTVGCYDYMFYICRKLKKKAKVPARAKLDNHTALNMYDGCPCQNK